MTLQGHPRTLILAPIKSSYRTSCLSSIVTLVLSCPISDILVFVCRKPFFDTQPLFSPKISRCYSWSRSVMLGGVEGKHLKQTNREIFSKNSNLCDHDTSTSLMDRQTDRRLVVAMSCSAFQTYSSICTPITLPYSALFVR